MHAGTVRLEVPVATASLLYALWQQREPKFKKLANKYGEGLDEFTVAEQLSESGSSAIEATVSSSSLSVQRAGPSGAFEQAILIIRAYESNGRILSGFSKLSAFVGETTTKYPDGYVKYTHKDNAVYLIAARKIILGH
jgi:hypothetical protein